MDLHRWQNRLASELKARKVPPAYARRLLDELQDHILDLQEADMNQGTEAESTIDFAERLGDPKELAEQASAAHVYPTWAGRHPWLAFVAWTPVLFLLSVAAFGLLLVGVATFFEGSTVATNPSLMQVVTLGGWAVAFLPAVVASLLLCRMVGRSGRRKLWALAACVLLAFLAGSLFVSCSPPYSKPGTGNFTIGLGVGAGWQFAQAVAPLLIGVVFVALGRKGTDKTEDDAQPQLLRSAA